jgi:hypothetical protein
MDHGWIFGFIGRIFARDGWISGDKI